MFISAPQNKAKLWLMCKIKATNDSWYQNLGINLESIQQIQEQQERQPQLLVCFQVGRDQSDS